MTFATCNVILHQMCAAQVGVSTPAIAGFFNTSTCVQDDVMLAVST